MKKYFKNLFIILLFTIFSASNGLCSNLDGLFNDLKNSQNSEKAKEFENKIWDYWISDGSNEINNQKMKEGINLINQGRLKDALSLFIKLSKSEPNWAEPINKIATIRFLIGDYYGSISDIQLTLKLEPRHFGAISGLAQINFALGRYEDALENIRYVETIHPYIGIKELKSLILDHMLDKQI